jgi:hypothetical protein
MIRKILIFTVLAVCRCGCYSLTVMEVRRCSTANVTRIANRSAAELRRSPGWPWRV